jgi:nicotinamidase-related amidase
MLTLDNTALVIIDVQGRLAQLMYQKETLFDNLQKIIKGAQVLELPIIWNEQLPEKLGPTAPEIAELLVNTTQPIAKASFSCCGNPPFMETLKGNQRKQVLLAGIESHICVYQSCLDLLNLGYEVQVVADAVSSRTAENRQIGLERMKEAGATLTSTEMALFELLRVAEGPKFKEITRIVK